MGGEIDEDGVDAEQVAQPGGGGQPVDRSPDRGGGGFGGAVAGGDVGRADRAEGPAPLLGAGPHAVAEAGQHAALGEHGEPVAGGVDVVERERGDLFGGQHLVLVQQVQ